MTFNKTKSMKNAEKYLTNGRIDAAISEYKQIVEHDPRDINSRNMLGDLYVKAARTESAVECYRRVAEYYREQGFAKKAIAVYNKVYKLAPDATDVVGKLGELYQMRGSIAEARAHYKTFAERLEKEGKNIEVLEVWYNIAELDPSDSDICLKIAETQRSRNQKEEASKAYFDAGTRLAEKGMHSAAVDAFRGALDMNDRFSKAVRGLVRAQILDGKAGDAAQVLEERIQEDPYNKEFIFLLIDCYFEMHDPEAAEEVIIKLVEREPANYPKLLDLVKVYLKNENAAAAVRILSMVSEHLLAGGDARTLEINLVKVIEADPQNVDGLRLLARCYGWQREQVKLKETLRSMAEAAKDSGRHADERWALSQYLVLVPHDLEFSKRFDLLVDEHGPEEADEAQLFPQDGAPAVPVSGRSPSGFGLESEAEFAAVSEGSGLVTHGSGDGMQGIVSATVVADETVVAVTDDAVTVIDSPAANHASAAKEIDSRPLSASDEVELDEELVSIRFYIEQGYEGLADKSLAALEQRFGFRQEIADLRGELSGSHVTIEDIARVGEPDEDELKDLPGVEAGSTGDAPPVANDPIKDIATDLGLDEDESRDPEDFEEHYNHGVAYKEMGLIDEAIREFQTAVECVEADDEERNFYHCCTMLGLSFLEKGMPKLSYFWFRRAYDECSLTAEERQALDYELGNVCELSNQDEEAIEHFERVYAQDVDYRDVSSRLESLREGMPVAG